MKYKYKVCVYAICKNEEKFVDTWYDSVKEADKIYVLDTGSDDNTVNLLKGKEKVILKQKIIKPWRFDVARNLSLDMVPMDTDICVCIDFDEVLSKGWRYELEKIWNKNINRVRYNYIWSFDKYNKPSIYFYLDNIHQRKDYYWTHPVHEVLTYTKDKEKYITTSSITLSHYPDIQKSRKSYLPLLELSVKEDPNDDRNMHYLGREYMYYRKYDKSIKTLKKHLDMDSAKWRDERCASMRFIGRCYKYLGNYDEARSWYEKAILEAPYLRDAYVEIAILYYELKNYGKMIKYCNRALIIKEKQNTYINEVFSWNYTIYDLLAIGFFELEEFEIALKYAKIALDMDKNNERLKNNYDIILDVVKRYAD